MVTAAEVSLAIAAFMPLAQRERRPARPLNRLIGEPDGRANPASLRRMSLEPAAIGSAQTRLGEPRGLDIAGLPEHFERLYRAAYGLCGHREDAEDLVQETYARVLRRPRLLRRDDDIVYLLRVLRNTWISRRRAASARPVAADGADVDWVADHRGDPTVALELQSIYAAMQDLPQALHETVVAVDVLGLSYRQAARALGTKEGTIMSRLYRARERIARELDPDAHRSARPPLEREAEETR
jgi:RNA polymerase sigma-70 factor (ECF subfamily)